MFPLPAIDGKKPDRLDEGWELTMSAPGRWARPSDIDSEAHWLPARVPGTAAAALRDAGRFDIAMPQPLENQDVWYRARLPQHGRKRLRFQGLATIAEVFLDEQRLLRSSSMFLAHDVDVELSGGDTLYIAFRALGPRLAAPRKRARWRPRMITPGNLRFFRTTLLGHMNLWCPPVHAIGPWRAIEMSDADAPLRIGDVRLRTAYENACGILEISLSLGAMPSDLGEPATLLCAGAQAPMASTPDGRLAARLVLPGVAPWWPHTHDEPRLHEIVLRIGGHDVALGRTGFRRIDIDRGGDGEGFGLKVNGVNVFCRGAVWTSPDLIGLPSGRADYEPSLRLMQEAHMNMVRIGGTMVYEADAFYQTCDELGLLVWQDFMFANFDYPADDPAFLALVTAEVDQFLARTQVSPSIAVLCGGSEVGQQSAMLGLPQRFWSNRIFDEIIPAAVTRTRPDAIYVPNTPCGGTLPIVLNKGVCHYYGVSAYRRPLEDARLADVRFAAESLGHANVPDGAVTLAPGAAEIAQPCWGERVPGDVSSIWFFEEVRNHYLATLYGLDPQALAIAEPDRYLALSRATSAELMEEVFARWRRVGSPTQGGLVWNLQDVIAGAGWGVIDAAGRPKSAFYALKRAFRPLQVLLLDEGLNGLDVHLLNDSAAARDVVLSIVCLRDGAVEVMRAERRLLLAPRHAVKVAAVELWGGLLRHDLCLQIRAAVP